MDPSIYVFGFWLLFGGSHVLIAASPLSSRMPTKQYIRFFFLVSASTFFALVAYYATHRYGRAGPALSQNATLAMILSCALVVGVVFMAAGLAVFSKSPMAAAKAKPWPVYGLARITRHPFMVGMILWGSAHALLSTTLAGSVFFGGFALLAWLGSIHQDRKLARRYGADYQEYLRTTSFVPFGAILTGRTTLKLRELPVAGIAVGIAAAFGLRWAHDSLMLYAGAPLSVSIILAAFIAGWKQLR